MTAAADSPLPRKMKVCSFRGLAPHQYRRRSGEDDDTGYLAEYGDWPLVLHLVALGLNAGGERVPASWRMHRLVSVRLPTMSVCWACGLLCGPPVPPFQILGDDHEGEK